MNKSFDKQDNLKPRKSKEQQAQKESAEKGQQRKPQQESRAPKDSRKQQG